MDLLYEALRKGLEKTMNSLNNFSQFVQSGKFLEAVNLSLRKTSMILIEHDMFPPHDLNFNHIAEIEEFLDRNDSASLKSFIEHSMLKWYDHSRIESYLTKWIQIEFLQDRHEILREVIELHCLNKYHASIPTLLPQIEGVLAKLTNMTYSRQQVVKDKFESITDPDSEFKDAIVVFFVEKVMMGRLEHGKPVDFPLSRNAILHGIDTGYGYELNSIRCILLFDYLVHRGIYLQGLLRQEKE